MLRNPITRQLMLAGRIYAPSIVKRTGYKVNLGDNIHEEDEEDDLLSDDAQGEYHAKLDNTQVQRIGLVMCSETVGSEDKGGITHDNI
jgi:hypothetical protein